MFIDLTTLRDSTTRYNYYPDLLSLLNLTLLIRAQSLSIESRHINNMAHRPDTFFIMCALREWSNAMEYMMKLYRKQRLQQLSYTDAGGFTAFHLIAATCDSITFLNWVLKLDKDATVATRNRPSDEEKKEQGELQGEETMSQMLDLGLASRPFYPRHFATPPCYPLHLAACFNNHLDIHRILLAAYPTALQIATPNQCSNVLDLIALNIDGRDEFQQRLVEELFEDFVEQLEKASHSGTAYRESTLKQITTTGADSEAVREDDLLAAARKEWWDKDPSEWTNEQRARAAWKSIYC